MNQKISSDIEKAHQLIAPFIHRTPILSSQAIDQICDCKIFFKAEHLQKIGAFKMRGASHFLQKLISAKKRSEGLKVVTHSSGNHAQAVALAAKTFGIRAIIVMPKNAPKIKVAGVRSYGGEVVFCEPTLEARESTMEEIRDREKAVFIPPFDHEDIILGQATAAKELIEDVEDLDYILVPTGGGGLLAGTALAAKAFSPNTKVLGCEPSLGNDAYQSFKSRKRIPSLNPQTLADGLRTSLGELNFEIIKEDVDDIICCSEGSMICAMQMVWERMKQVIEPSAAVPLAALSENTELFKGKKVGIIISGGNVDLSVFFDHLHDKAKS